MKRPLRFQYGRRKDGLWYWHIRAGNSEIVAEGEGYKRKGGILKVWLVLSEGMDGAQLVEIV